MFKNQPPILSICSFPTYKIEKFNYYVVTTPWTIATLMDWFYFPNSLQRYISDYTVLKHHDFALQQQAITITLLPY